MKNLLKRLCANSIEYVFTRIFRRSRDIDMSLYPIKADSTMNILLISLDHIGDAVMATPLPRIIKNRFPKVNIVLLTRPVTAPIFYNNPFIDEIVLDNAPWWTDRPLLNSLNLDYWHKLIPKIKAMRKCKYDVILDLRSDLRHILLFGVFLDPHILVGNTRTGGEGLLDFAVPYQDDLHEIRKKTSLLKPLGIEAGFILPELFLVEEEIIRAEKILNSLWDGRKVPFILIDPGGKPVQRWPLARFAKIARTLSKRWNTAIVVSVAPTYKQIGEDLHKMIGLADARLIRGLDLKTLSAIVSLSDLVISSDTGIVHLAKAVGSSTLTIFGPTDPGRFGYEDNRSRIVRASIACPSYILHEKCKMKPGSIPGICILEIAEKSVINAADELMALRIEPSENRFHDLGKLDL